MRRTLLSLAFLAAAACGRSWVFDDFSAVAETSGGASSGGHGSGSTGHTSGSGSTGTTTGCGRERDACGERPCCEGFVFEPLLGQTHGMCVVAGASSSGSSGLGTTGGSSGGTTTTGSSSTTGGGTTGTSSGGTTGGGSTTGGCSTKDCVGAADCCPAIDTTCGQAGLQGCAFGLCVYDSPPCGTTSGGSSGGSIGNSTSGGSSGGTTGSSTTGGTTTGGTTGGVDRCNPSASPVEFLSCAKPSDCGCPLLCVHDALAGQVCEYPCSSTPQCPDLLTVCNGTNCQLDACGPGTGNGAYNSFCQVTSPNDGSCIPLQLSNGTVYGVCAQGGSAATSCNATANRLDLAEVCQAGMVCIGGAIGTGGVCGDVCDPKAGGPCPPGQSCAFTVDDPLAGACYTP